MTESSPNQLRGQSAMPLADFPTPEKSTVRSGPIVGVLAFAGIVAAVMQTLVVPLIGAMPELLGTSASDATWVVTATLLAAAVATPISGRLGDLYGKKRVMLACSVLLVAGSLVCALATSLIPMIVGRSLQGAAMGLVPLGISATRDLLPPEKRGTSIALMSASMGIGGALGLPTPPRWQILELARIVLGCNRPRRRSRRPHLLPHPGHPRGRPR